MYSVLHILHLFLIKLFLDLLKGSLMSLKRKNYPFVVSKGLMGSILHPPPHVHQLTTRNFRGQEESQKNVDHNLHSMVEIKCYPNFLFLPGFYEQRCFSQNLPKWGD